MAKLDRYIDVGAKRLRCGYTTGTCAAAAARGAAELLAFGSLPQVVQLIVPAGIAIDLDLEEPSCGEGWAQCAVRKDGGDDIDVTDGALVFARVEWSDAPGVQIDGGIGVGRVTRPGLDQPVGNAAINSVPRSMIEQQVRAVLDNTASSSGMRVTIFVPDGEALAVRTFNPNLGIEGGISIIGTSGIVKPMSEDALIESIQVELRMRAAEGVRNLLVAPGNYGIDFARDELGLRVDEAVQCSNYVGATFDGIVRCGFESVLVVGHIGKMVKVAAGIMNTHSHVADARLETLAAHAACAGASRETAARIMAAATTDAALDILVAEGLLEPVMASVVERVGHHLRRRAGDVHVEAVVFSKVQGLLGMTEGAQDLMEGLR